MLLSGSGTNLQALLDASADPSYGATVVAVGADREPLEGLAGAKRAGVPTFVRRVTDYGSRPEWDEALAEEVAAHRPDLVVAAGFLKLVGPAFLARFGGRYVNTHNTLLPAFPGMHGPRDALAYGVKVSGATLHFVDEGVDTGPIIAQTCVPVLDDDTEGSLTERIKTAERQQLVDVVGRMVRNGWRIEGRRVRVLPDPSGGAAADGADGPVSGAAPDSTSDPAASAGAGPGGDHPAERDHTAERAEGHPR